MSSCLALRAGAVLVAASLTACTGGSTAPPASAPTSTAFTSSFGGFFNVTGGNPTGAPPVVVIHGTGIGADSAGSGTAAFDQTITFSTPTNQISGGVFTFTYADGSTLKGTYSGSGPPPNANGIATATGPFTVTSGTGRYARGAGATGTFSVTAQIFAPGSTPGGPIDVTFEGVMPT